MTRTWVASALLLLFLAASPAPLVAGGDTGGPVLRGALGVGSVYMSADSARSMVVLGANWTGGYIDVALAGIDYSPEPNHFNLAVLRLLVNGSLGVRKLGVIDRTVDKGYVPSTNMLFGGAVGVNWTLVVGADKRPYASPPSKVLAIYGVSWNGSKLGGPVRLASIDVGMPARAIRLLPGPGRGEVTLFYAAYTRYRSGRDYSLVYGAAVYSLAEDRLVSNTLLPVKLDIRGSSRSLTISRPGRNETVGYSRFMLTLIPCPDGSGRAEVVLVYVAGDSARMATWSLDLYSGSTSSFFSSTSMGYGDLAADHMIPPSGGETRLAVALAKEGGSKVDVRVYGCGGGGLKTLYSGRFSPEGTQHLQVRAAGGGALLFTGLRGDVYASDAAGHGVRLLHLSGSFYVRFAPVPGGNDTYLAAIGTPGSYTKLRFVLLNPPKGLAPATTTATTRTTTTGATTTATRTTQTTKTTTSTTRTTATTRTATTPTATTTTRTTTTTATAPPAGFPLKAGDWLKYRVRAKGEGPKGKMSVEAELRVTVEEIRGGEAVLVAEPLTKLSAEKRSLLLIGAMTGNRLVLAAAGGSRTSITLRLPLAKPSKACPIIADTGGQPQRIEDSGETMGHKYTVTCAYTSKGVLSEMVLRDTYSAAGQTLKTEIRLSLADSSADLGGGSGGSGGAGLPMAVLAAIVAAIAIVAAVVLIKLRG